MCDENRAIKAIVDEIGPYLASACAALVEADCASDACALQALFDVLCKLVCED